MGKQKLVKDAHPHKSIGKRSEGLLPASTADLTAMSGAELQELVCELQAHQVELETENEELRLSDIELTHSRDRYSDLYEFAPVGYLSVHRSGVVLQANLAAATLLGVERRQLVRADFSDFVSPESRDAWHLYRRAIFSAGNAADGVPDNPKRDLELEMHRSDGAVLAVRLESLVFPAADGTLDDCRMALIDLTERRLAEQALRRLSIDLGQSLADSKTELQQGIEQIRLLNEAVSHLAEGILITDGDRDWPDPRIRFVNAAMCRITGYAEDELVCRTPRMLQGEATDRAARDRLEAALSANRSCNLELVNLRKDGTPYDAEVVITPLLDAAGRRTNFVAIHRDVTDRKQAELALRSNEAMLEAALSSMSDAVSIFDAQGRLHRFNAAFATFHRFRDKTECARTLAEHPDLLQVYAPDGRLVPLHQSITPRALRGESGVDAEYRLRRKDTGETWIGSYNFAPIRGRQSAIIGSVIVGRDITEKKRAERMLRESRTQLQAETEALSRLNDATMRIWRMSDLREGLDEILCAAMGMMQADFGEVQLLDPERDLLVIAAHQGFGPDFLAFFREVSTACNSACGRALRSGVRTMIDDVEADPLFAPYREITQAAGFRAVQATPLIGSDGKVLGMLSTHWRKPHRLSEQELRRLDLYARQAAGFIEQLRTQQALRYSEERFRKVFEFSRIGIAIADWEVQFQQCNPAYCRLTGYAESELRQFSFQSLVHLDDREAHLDGIGRLKAGELSNFEIENRYVRKDGHAIWVRQFVSLLRGEAGDPAHFVALVTDQTERRRTEQAIREREQRLRAILDTAADAIITTDRRGLITDANPATARMFGYTPAELVGQDVRILMPWPCCDEHDGNVSSCRKTGGAHNTGGNRDALARRKDGSTIPVALSVSQIDQLGVFTGIVRDMSDRTELQRQILEIAGEQDRRIGQELHDNVQQQLTGLDMIAHSLAKALEDKSLPEVRLAALVAAGIKETARQVRLLARGLVPVEIDAQGLLLALSDLAAWIQEQHRIRCELQSDAAVEVTDNFVATHLYRIAQEAISNAIRHSKCSRITISLARDDDSILLQVRDDGIGITGKDKDGPGLGLKIMQYRAGLLGGSVRIESAGERGTLLSCSVSGGE